MLVVQHPAITKAIKAQEFGQCSVFLPVSPHDFALGSFADLAISGQTLDTSRAP